MSTVNRDQRLSPATRPVKAVRAFEEVANHVLDLVRAGALRPGDRLPAEREFSRQLEVSRSALREALRMLEHSGVLELYPGKGGGAFIRAGDGALPANPVADMFRLGSVSLSDLTESRFWITETVVRVATERATATDFEALEANVVLAEQQFQRRLFQQKSDTNIAFHDLLARATRNPVLVAMVGMLNEVVRGFSRQLGQETTRRTFDSRRRLLNAMRRRDPDAAAREMLANLRKTHEAYVALARTAARAPASPRRASAKAKAAPSTARVARTSGNGQRKPAGR